MYSLGLLVRLALRLPWATDPRLNPRSWRRWMVACGVLLVLVPLEWINSLALRLDPWLFRFRDIEPIRPIFVVGVPRSGTTLLHRLLMVDQPRLTTMTLGELVFAPAIIQKLFWRMMGKADRMIGRPLQRTVRWLEQRFANPLHSIHPTSLFAPEEDYLGLLPFAGCFLLVQLFPFADEIWELVEPTSDTSAKPSGKEPAPRDGGIASRRRQLLQHYRGLVQRHLYVVGKEKIYLSKNPSFTPWVPSLLREFPDARVLGCYRDPAEAIPSLLSSMESGAALVGNDGNRNVQEGLVRMMENFYRCLLIDYRKIANYRSVHYAALVSEPLMLLHRICRELGLDSIEFHENLRKACLTATAYRSQHRYNLEQFGLEIAKIRLELDFVYEAMERESIPEMRTS